MRNQAVILLLALLGATTAHAADTDRELARQLALQQKTCPLLSNQGTRARCPTCCKGQSAPETPGAGCQPGSHQPARAGRRGQG